MENLSKQISKTLKSLRQDKGWSLDAASLKTGVSKAMLGQIERGESSPTIATLWKIVNGFEVPFSWFVDGKKPIDLGKAPRHADFKQIHPADNKILIKPLFAFDKALNFEMYIIELLPGCEHISSPHQKGVIEHIVVVSGTIEVLVNNKWHAIQPKEGLRLNADQPHGYRNRTSAKAIFHDIIHYSHE